MSAATPIEAANRLIEGLPPKERYSLLKHCVQVNLLFGTTLYGSAQRFAHVYFPLTAIISQVALADRDRQLEIGLIGNEGMLGATLVLGVEATPLCAVVQGSGIALRMTARQLQGELRDNPAVLRMLNRYLYVLMWEFSQTAACTCFHPVEERLARCLLMTHDRAHADHFYLTHKFLGDMLGVRRSAVTIAAGTLQHKKLIRYSRGEIKILDRRGLEAASCGCYDAVAKHYAQLLV